VKVGKMQPKPTVLIVDDEPEIGSLLGLFLEDDFEVTTFTDPRVACDEITKKSYDLVISDIKMPFLSGLDVVRHVKSVRPSTFIVLMTGHAQTGADKAEALGLGASGVLFKPFGDPSKVIEYLQSLLVTPASAPAPSSVSASASAAPKANKPLIMAMDDDTGILEVLEILLSDDFTLRTFTDPTKALAHLPKEDFKAILTDLNMPQMSGKDAIIEIRKQNPAIPIMVMTGHGQDEPEALAALAAGGTVILEKPFSSVDVLLEKIGKLIK
jgi:DNA-binding NtrC family response regulator